MSVMPSCSKITLALGCFEFVFDRRQLSFAINFSRGRKRGPFSIRLCADAKSQRKTRAWAGLSDFEVRGYQIATA